MAVPVDAEYIWYVHGVGQYVSACVVFVCAERKSVWLGSVSWKACEVTVVLHITFLPVFCAFDVPFLVLVSALAWACLISVEAGGNTSSE